MTDMALTTAAEPDGAQDGSSRLPLLDVLRGVAILGILFMNISDMGGSLFAFVLRDPRRYGWSAGDQVTWWVREVLANGTARCLLEMLFGAGMVILTDRAAGRMAGWQVLRGYAWRNAVLLGLGLAHLWVLLWPGDILHTYALAALIAVLFRTLRPRLLLTIGLAMATLQLVGVGASVAHTAYVTREVARIEAIDAPSAADRKGLADAHKWKAEKTKSRAALTAKADAEDRGRSGTAGEWVRTMLGLDWYLLSSGLELIFVWEAASTMLIGAALFKLGILQGERGRGFYARLAVIGYAIGLPLRAWAAGEVMRFDGSTSLAMAFGEYARLATTLGHVGLLALIMTGTMERWVRPFAAAGRTALTLYILQTLVTLWVLYPPWGLALYRQQNWVEMMATALLIDAALLALAVWWVRRFNIAPVEWAWRSLVARRALPFRKVAAPLG